MLKTLKLHNFKTFLNTEIHFSRRHLIVGKNNSGKTNLASAIRFLGATASGELMSVGSLLPGGVAEMRNWHLKSDRIELSCTCDLEFRGKPCEFGYELVLAVGPLSTSAMSSQVELRVARERLTVSAEGFDNVTLLESDGREALMLHEEQVLDRPDPHQAKTLAPKNATMLSQLYELETNRRAILFRNYLRHWCYYAISPFSIGRRTVPGPFADLILSPHGENLGNAIFHLKNMDERRYRRVIENTQIVEPALEAINFLVAPNQEPYPVVVLKDCPSASWTGLSDGTLRVLALAYLVEQAAAVTAPDALGSFVAVIEEPENGIFPGQLRKVFDLFEEWAPRGQFIFTSHSPYFIDMFDNKRDSVTLLEKTTDRSLCRALPAPEPPDVEDRLTLSDQYASELFE